MPDDCGRTVIQGDPEQHNADVLLRMSANSVVSEHWHTSAERMIVMSGRMQFDYVGHDSLVAEPGDYFYGPAELARRDAEISQLRDELEYPRAETVGRPGRPAAK